MALEDALRVLNQMRADRVIGAYAIGGAVAAFLYIEPGTTFDLDIFLVWEPSPGGLLDLGPIYTYLTARGYLPRREGVMIEDWEVQFLPVASRLDEEALESAVEVDIGGVATHVFTQEHLMALCLQTGRPKDFARLVQFAEDGNADQSRLRNILQRHGLGLKWESFASKFLTQE